MYWQEVLVAHDFLSFLKFSKERHGGLWMIDKPKDAIYPFARLTRGWAEETSLAQRKSTIFANRPFIQFGGIGWLATSQSFKNAHVLFSQRGCWLFQISHTSPEMPGFPWSKPVLGWGRWVSRRDRTVPSGALSIASRRTVSVSSWVMRFPCQFVHPFRLLSIHILKAWSLGSY